MAYHYQVIPRGESASGNPRVRITEMDAIVMGGAKTAIGRAVLRVVNLLRR